MPVHIDLPESREPELTPPDGVSQGFIQIKNGCPARRFGSENLREIRRRHARRGAFATTADCEIGTAFALNRRMNFLATNLTINRRAVRS